MSDNEAYTALALSNAQSELHPLEEGYHALQSGLSGHEYARRVGKPQRTVADRLSAARVAQGVTVCTVTFSDLSEKLL